MRADAAPTLVRIVVQTRAIALQGARERPVVHPADWDARGYADERARLWREALSAPLTERGAGLQVTVDLDDPGPSTPHTQAVALGGDELFVIADGAEASALHALIGQAARAVVADTGGWRRFLQPGWFERHRTWRREVGSPIQH